MERPEIPIVPRKKKRPRKWRYEHPAENKVYEINDKGEKVVVLTFS